jgi:hypothetical protein
MEDIMEKKKLLQGALTALAIASAAPVAADLAEINNTAGTFLAAGCGGGGGGGGRCGGMRSNVSYNDNYRRYQADNAPNQPYNSSASAYDASAGNAGMTSSRNYNSNYSSNPSYSDSYRSYSSDDNDTRSDYMSQSGSDAEFQRQLSPQAKSIYQNLDAEGKTLARQLGSQEAYKDKDLAVKEAQRRVNERRGSSSNMSGMNGMNDRSSSWAR